MPLCLYLEDAIGGTDAGDIAVAVRYDYFDSDHNECHLHGQLMLVNYNPYRMRGTFFLILDRIPRCFSMPARDGLEIINMAGSVRLDEEKIKALFSAKIFKRLKA